MKLPNANRVIIEIEKLHDYCLSATHPRGKHKAHVFSSVLRMTADDSEELRQTILSDIFTEEAVESEKDEYGQRYTLTSS